MLLHTLTAEHLQPTNIGPQPYRPRTPRRPYLWALLLLGPLLLSTLTLLGCSGSKPDANTPDGEGTAAELSGGGEGTPGAEPGQDGDEPSGPADEDVEVPPAP